MDAGEPRKGGGGGGGTTKDRQEPRPEWSNDTFGLLCF